MNIETLRNYCMAKPGATESFPFDEVTLVFKVGNKIFALANTEGQPTTLALKCDPERAMQLREEHDAVVPGYHLNKKHWNTITINGSVQSRELRDWIDHSYELVSQRLSKAVRAELM